MDLFLFVREIYRAFVPVLDQIYTVSRLHLTLCSRLSRRRLTPPRYFLFVKPLVPGSVLVQYTVEKAEPNHHRISAIGSSSYHNLVSAPYLYLQFSL